MAHPGIFAILVGFAIGTAIYYYLNSDSPQSHQYSSNENVYGENRYRYSPNNALKYVHFIIY